MFFSLCKFTDNSIFHDFTKIYDHFPKIFQNCPEDQTNIPKHFPRISEDIQRFPKTLEEESTQRCFDDKPANLSII